MGPHLHPEIILSAIPMGLSMKGWESDNYELIAKHLDQGVNHLAAGLGLAEVTHEKKGNRMRAIYF